MNKKELTYSYNIAVSEGDTATIYKYGSYVTSLNYKNDDLVEAAFNNVSKANQLGFEQLLEEQKKSWEAIWHMADIDTGCSVGLQQPVCRP